MAFIGAKPTNVPLTASDITDGSISVAKLTSALDLSSNTVTLPSGVGGKVLQVVTATTNFLRLNSDHTTFVDVESSSGTSFITSITPSSSSNKILILASIMSNNYQSSGEGDQRGFVSLLGDINGAGYSTLVNRSKTGGYAYGGTSYGVSIAQTTTYNFLWSPSTTSQCNVKFQFRPVGANGNMATSGGSSGEDSECTCNLLEVSG